MRSRLTPRIFRSLLSAQGLTFRCPTQAALSTRTRPRNAPRSLIRAPYRRSLWGFSPQEEKAPTKPDLPPGLETMMEATTSQDMGTRPPSVKQLIDAWDMFFKYYSERSKQSGLPLAVNSTQAKHILHTFLYLSREAPEEFTFRSRFRLARAIMARLPPDGQKEHETLARAFFEALTLVKDRDNRKENNVRKLVEVLAQCGQSAEARDLLIDLSNDATTAEDYAQTRGPRDWALIVNGFAREGNEAEMLKTISLAEERGLSSKDGTFATAVTKFYAEQGNVDATKMWYKKLATSVGSDSTEEPPYHAILPSLYELAIGNNELEWCKEVVRHRMEMGPSKHEWDVILKWAAGTMGKGVEDVERMMDFMRERSTDDKPTIPDADTINGLVEIAMVLKDPYLAERYISLGQRFGIQPNARTFIMQLEYRADKGDLSGAKSAYDALQGEEILEDADLPAINKYIRSLCAADDSFHARLVSVISDLEERSVHLEADTTSTLAMTYLYRDEVTEAIDLLQANAYHYTETERNMIQSRFEEFCFNPQNSTAEVYDAYTIMRSIFDETSLDVRTKMMKEFFRRGRCDMACHTFGHMRQHLIADRRPILETYIECFLGIASLPDRQYLDMVHNMLKLDSSIDPSTKLYNALMIVYTACGDAGRALHFWDDITNSNEGPSYNSLVIVFGACQRKPFGDRLAREIWAKIKRMEIEITRPVYEAYVAALAGQGKLDEAKALVDGMEAQAGFKPDVTTIGLLYNAIPGQNRKDLVEEWALALYPEVWEELVKIEQTEHPEGHRTFNLKREFKA